MSLGEEIHEVPAADVLHPGTFGLSVQFTVHPSSQQEVRTQQNPSKVHGPTKIETRPEMDQNGARPGPSAANASGAGMVPGAKWMGWMKWMEEDVRWLR